MACGRSSFSPAPPRHRHARHDAQLVQPAFEAAELVKHAMQMKPDPLGLGLSAVLAHAYRLMPRYDEAVDVYKQAIALAPNQIAAHLGLTICYAQAGQLELARI